LPLNHKVAFSYLPFVCGSYSGATLTICNLVNHKLQTAQPVQ